MLCLVTLFLLKMTWRNLVGPRAVIIVPNSFTGIFGISSRDYYHREGFSLFSTPHMYQLPPDGALWVKEGWVATATPGRGDSPYSTEVRREDGTLVIPACAYVEDYWDFQPTRKESFGIIGGISIACRIRNEHDQASASIDQKEADQFFREHFRAKLHYKEKPIVINSN